MWLEKSSTTLPKPKNSLLNEIENMLKRYTVSNLSGVYDQVKSIQDVLKSRITLLQENLRQRNVEINEAQITQILNDSLATKLNDFISCKDSSEPSTESAKNMLEHLTTILKELRKPKNDLDPDLWNKVKATFVSKQFLFIDVVFKIIFNSVKH